MTKPEPYSDEELSRFSGLLTGDYILVRDSIQRWPAVTAGDPDPLRLLATITALKAERVWQPIETAPRDGSRFLAFQRGDGDQRFECWWQDDFGIWSGWMDDWDGEPEPTHWMPLPTPPETGGQE